MSQLVCKKVQDGKTGEFKELMYTQQSVVGSGSFGIVFQTKLSPSNEDAAIKRVLQDKRFKVCYQRLLYYDCYQESLLYYSQWFNYILHHHKRHWIPVYNDLSFQPNSLFLQVYWSSHTLFSISMLLNCFRSILTFD